MNINKKIIYIIENKGITEDFETVKLERTVRESCFGIAKKERHGRRDKLAIY